MFSLFCFDYYAPTVGSLLFHRSSKITLKSIQYNTLLVSKSRLGGYGARSEYVRAILFFPSQFYIGELLDWLWCIMRFSSQKSSWIVTLLPVQRIQIKLVLFSFRFHFDWQNFINSIARIYLDSTKEFIASKTIMCQKPAWLPTITYTLTSLKDKHLSTTKFVFKKIVRCNLQSWIECR